MTTGKHDFGMIGLGTMGHALLLNMADHGHSVAGFDTDPKKAEALSKDGDKVEGFSDLAAFVSSIRKPRAIMMLVPAGKPVDSVIASVMPHLEAGDFLIDGGNSYFKDTIRRVDELAKTGIGFMGMGVSGGERGARRGPSMMPGGTPTDYERVRPILESVAAKHEGESCVALMGSGAAGHYVKTVHNGIEYAVMQIIAEIYDLQKTGLGKSNLEIAELFETWSQSQMGGFLVEIASTVLRYPADGGGQLVDLISDKAKSKGTGKWTSQDAMDLGLPIPTIDAAVSARELSGYKDERVRVAKLIGSISGSLNLSVEQLAGAFTAASLLSYIQGLAQIVAASGEYGFGTDLTQVLRVWRAGCIIRSRLLDPLAQAVSKAPEITNLLLDADMAKLVEQSVIGLRGVVAEAVKAGIPVPALSASLAYFDGYRRERLPANLIQGQRDLFGAHTYERTDQPGSFHTLWETSDTK